MGKAQRLLSNICRTDRKDAEAWLMLGAVYGQLGDDMAEVVRCNKQVLSLDPDNPGALSNLGNALSHLDRYEEAATSYREALALQPNDPEILNNLGNALHLAGKSDEAIACYQQALNYNPGHFEAHMNLGRTYVDCTKHAAAEETYRRALVINPGSTEAFSGLAGALRSQGRQVELLDYCRQVLRNQPGNAGAMSAQAVIYERMGEPDKAYERIRALLEAGEENAVMADVFTRICRKYDRCDEALVLARRLLADAAATDAARQNLHFALGQLYDKLHAYEDAFAHFRQGNDLARGRFDQKQHSARIDALIKAYNLDSMAALPRASAHSERPVFIVGMPRSGTSLTEQILASHAQVFGAGELNHMNELVTNLHTTLGTDKLHPACVPLLTQAHLNSLAQKHLEQLDGFSPDALRITDKMPPNFLHLGLIALLFPGARIIHCVRDPLDTCLSIYFQKFNSSHAYATDLGNLGFYYREYQRLMGHWQKVIELPLMEVRYEELVANQETVSRAMVEFCGLEWDEACLRYHESERHVITASYEQVRKPIYRKSVGRWKNYARYLAPLMDSLG